MPSSPAACRVTAPWLPNVGTISGIRDRAGQSIEKNDELKTGQPKPVDTEQSLETIWGKITQVLSSEHPSLAACFADSRVAGANDHQITIEFISNPFNINYAQRDDNKSLLSRLWKEHLGRETQLSLIAKPAAGSDAKKKEKKQLEGEALNNPLVTQSLKLFNGKIVEIKIL